MSDLITLEVAQVTTGLETSIVAQFGDQVFTLMNQLSGNRPVYYPVVLKDTYYFLLPNEDLLARDCYPQEMLTAFPNSSWLTTSRTIKVSSMTLHKADSEKVSDLQKQVAEEEIPF